MTRFPEVETVEPASTSGWITSQRRVNPRALFGCSRPRLVSATPTTTIGLHLETNIGPRRTSATSAPGAIQPGVRPAVKTGKSVRRPTPNVPRISAPRTHHAATAA